MKNAQKSKQAARILRHRRVRARISGTASVPRLSVYRSLLHIYAQLIDDIKGVTILSASDLELKRQKGSSKSQPSDQLKLTSKALIAYQVGELLAVKAKKKSIKKLVFDRGIFKYHGRIKALAEGVRKGGIDF